MEFSDFENHRVLWQNNLKGLVLDDPDNVETIMLEIDSKCSMGNVVDFVFESENYLNMSKSTFFIHLTGKYFEDWESRYIPSFHIQLKNLTSDWILEKVEQLKYQYQLLLNSNINVLDELTLHKIL